MADGWDELLQRELEVCHLAVEHATAVPEIENHQVVAITIMLRLLRHAEGTRVLLAEPGLVVEARTLVRNCYECLFFLARIAEQGASVIDDMRRAELGSRKVRAEFMFEHSIGDQQLRDNLREWVRTNAKGASRQQNTPRELSRGSQIEIAYLAYAELSANSAHVTLDSLDRHLIERGSDAVDFTADPLPRAGELEDTKLYLSTALCGAVVALNQSLGYPMPSAPIGEIWDAHASLMKLQY